MISSAPFPIAARGYGLFGLLAAILVAGCCPIRGTLPDAVPIVGSGVFSAGASKIDLTPPPGFPMGGHGFAGKTGRGYWTRLYARAFYLEDAVGHPLVLVSCDLWSVPGGLGDRVAELIHKDLSCQHVGRESIVLAATHTHHSPGNYSTSAAYNTLASPGTGFDETLFEFLARRIAQAVVQAKEHAVKAEMTVSVEVVGEMSRNRGFPAFLRDGESAAIIESNKNGVMSDVNGPGTRLPAVPPTAFYPDPDAAMAVYPEVTVLHFRRAGPAGRSIGMAAFLSVHPTTMSHSSEVYSAELFGAVAARCEQQLVLDGGEAGSDAVVGLFNGAEGDVSPIWETQDRITTLRDAETLSKAILAMAAANTPASTEIDSAAEIVRLPGASFMDAQGVHRELAEDAEPGAATLGGVADGFTPLHDLGWKEGVVGPRREHQGNKQPAFDPIGLQLPEFFSPTHLLSEALEVPDRALIAVHRLGTLTIATLPGEFTTVMGKRIRAAIKKRAKLHRDGVSRKTERVLLAGLANEYISYVATPEEYAAQYYEGASTLYGPATGPYFIRRLGSLSEELGKAKPIADRSFRYCPGPSRRYRVEDVGEAPYFYDDGLVDLLLDPRTRRPQRAQYSYYWEESVSGDFILPLDPKRSPTPRVSIEVQSAGAPGALLQTLPTIGADGTEAATRVLAGGVPETDEGLHFVTIALSSAKGRSAWRVIWMPPAGLDVTPDLFFRIETLDGKVLSAPVRRP
jgi:neutral ceramidase